MSEVTGKYGRQNLCHKIEFSLVYWPQVAFSTYWWKQKVLVVIRAVHLTLKAKTKSIKGILCISKNPGNTILLIHNDVKKWK